LRVAGKKTKGRAKAALSPLGPVPAPSDTADDQGPIEHDNRITGALSPAETPGGGQQHIDTPKPIAAPDDIPLRLMDLQRARVATIKAQRSLNNRVRSYVRRAMGWQTDLPEADRKRINTAAAKLVKAVEKGTPADGDSAATAELAVRFIVACKRAREALDEERVLIEKEMLKLAKALLVWRWALAQIGFGALGLAIIVGEAGDLGKYDNPAKLWKRFGVGLVGERTQGKPGKGATAEDWIAHGYNPQRRSALWTIGDCLVKQGNGYREVFLARKHQECEKAVAEGLIVTCTTQATLDNWKAVGLPAPIRIKSKQFDPAKHRAAGHIHKRAQRYMEKRLLRDLWRAWRGVTA